ncbi:antigen-presenting glycoprotein CD1d-like [Nothoprocta perdicaria]|uniref:antigen-presenting glycoprotein CD1d-like n=1 Tax=Nothoprocta perdicaria TaxID=30464 RepID=UPI000E1BF261|nr:antigen-presenting glycoprotein CD1d-like [Nothoprocta perdicaria]
MLALLLFLLLLPSGGDQKLEAAFPPVSGPSVLRLLQTTTFHNATSVATEARGLLDDIPLGFLDSRTWSIHFLQPWVQPALPRSDWDTISDMVKIYLSKFHHLIQEGAVLKQVPYPFVAQCTGGCLVFPNDTGRAFVYVGYNGDDFLTYDMDKGSWLLLQDTELARYVRDRLENYTAFTELIQVLFNNTCVDDVQMILRAAKEALQRQVPPVAVVFAHETPDPSQLLLVCRVTGFYPSAVRVSWLRDGHEVAPQPGPGSSPLLPNADLTYQLRRAVAAAPGAAHGYACRVQHSSLGGRDLLLPWGTSGTALVVGLSVAASVLVAAAAAAAFWVWRRRHCRDTGESEPRASILSSGEDTAPGAAAQQ